MAAQEAVRVTQAVISAGGVGTRLRTITGDFPKILAKVGKKTLLERHLENLDSWGIEECLLLLGHNSNIIEDYLRKVQDRYQVSVLISNEEEPLGTGGSILNAFDELQDSFIYFHGDLFVNLPRQTLESLCDQNTDFSLFVHETSHPEDSDLVEFVGERITKFITKPHPTTLSTKNYGNAGFYFFKKYVFENLKHTNQKLDLDREIIPVLLSKGFTGSAKQNYWEIRDVGTPQRFLKTNTEIESGRLGRKKRPAILLDRDGTINLQRGQITSPFQFEMVEGVPEGIKLINEAGVLAIVITNQPAIARGELSYIGLDLIHAKMASQIELGGGKIDGVYFCPHHPDKGFVGEVLSLKIDCNCRKPKSGLIKNAFNDFGIDRELCIMIGDTWRDEKAAENAGIKFEHVLSPDNEIDFLNTVKRSLRFIEENRLRVNEESGD
jgi:mannose-1-phosphate guanylyltransferase/phosphomannomutase